MILETSPVWTVISSLGALGSALFAGFAAWASWSSVKEVRKERTEERKVDEEERERSRPEILLASIELLREESEQNENFGYMFHLSNPKGNRLLRMHYVIVIEFVLEKESKWDIVGFKTMNLFGSDKGNIAIHYKINDVNLRECKTINITGFFKTIDIHKGEDNYVSNSRQVLIKNPTEDDYMYEKLPVSINKVIDARIVYEDFGYFILDFPMFDKHLQNVLSAHSTMRDEIDHCASNEVMSAFKSHVQIRYKKKFDFVLFD